MRQIHFSAFRELCGTPSRIAWAVALADGQRSICPLGWHMQTSMHPPMMAISIAPGRFTHDLIAASGEFVLAWPGEDLATATMLCGTHSGRTMDKFAEAHLTPHPGQHVQAPLVVECMVNMECRVVDRLTSGDHTIFVGEILATWADEARKKPLCSIGYEKGYQVLQEGGHYRFGVVKG